MVGATIFSTIKIKFTCLGRLEPGRSVSPRYHVLLDAKLWYIEAVNNIFRDHGEAHGIIYRNMQLIDLGMSRWMLKLPHPLLTHNIDLHGFCGQFVHLEVDSGPPTINAHCHEEKHHNPACFQ